MCTRQEVREEVVKALQDNNTKRDSNLDDKLQSLKMEIFEKVDQSISSRLKHTEPSPLTAKMIETMKDNCAKTSNQYNTTQQLMMEDLKNIREYMAEDKIWKKEFSQLMVERLKEKADQKDIDEMKGTLEKLKQFRWQALAIIGVAWALFEKYV